MFSRPIAIASDDIDMLGHVNNIVYLRWAQDIAVAHWRAMALEEWRTRYIWVVARHEVDYRAPLTLGTEVEARTWVDDAPARGALWARFVEIGAPNAKPAAEIKSTWCLLDAATRRPVRVPKDIIARFASPSDAPPG